MIVRLAAAIGLLSGSVRPPPTHRAHIFASASANTSLLDKLAAPIPFSEDDGVACLIDEVLHILCDGNAKKQREVNAILSAEQMSPFRVTHVDIDLPELQGDPIDIAKAKWSEAAKRDRRRGRHRGYEPLLFRAERAARAVHQMVCGRFGQ